MFDFEYLEGVDSAGLVLLLQYVRKLTKRNCSLTFKNIKDEHKRALVFYRKNLIIKQEKKKHLPNPIVGIGKKGVGFFGGVLEYLTFIGESSYHAFLTLINPKKLRLTALIKHIEHSGIRALPIIGLTSFLVGLVIAYQASEQLAKFGANIFIVEMSAISVFRELSPLIAAIVIAGRSASSYTAEIGTMKITEEIDAMRTMGFDPQVFLVLPRIFALVISMPLIVFFADMVGLFGGMIVAKYSLDITFVEFIHRLQAEVDMKHLLIGLAKSPVFGIIIASIGCYRGFQVTGSTDSIGNFTTISVVNAIFWVIACNAAISVFLTEIGI